MRTTETVVPPFPQYFSIADDHGADERIGTDASATVLGELDSAGQVDPIGVGADGHGTKGYGARAMEALRLGT